MKNSALIFPALLTASTLGATLRTSENYAVVTESIDFGGQQSASTDYAGDGCIAPVVSSAGAASQPTVARHGFVGQLYELVGHGLLATDFYPAELGTTQVYPVATANDGTNVAIPFDGFSFSIAGGPLASVSSSGLVTAGAVYENTAATVSATSSAFEGELSLLLYVQEIVPDNFGLYAGDSLADDWQVRHFGVGNPLAGPTQDADGDGQNNLFEFTAGLVPTDATSAFRVVIEPAPETPGRVRLSFSPVWLDRIYEVKAKAALTDPTWLPLSEFSAVDEPGLRRVTDNDPRGAQKFYTVEIQKP